MTMRAATAVGPRERTGLTFPVVEIFGPTIQGEGPDAGRPAYFVRFGGCDFRCSWCDSMHAVDPQQVRDDARHLVAGEILAELQALPPGPQLVVLSGGNPALLDLGSLVGALHGSDLDVAVETQGSRWKPWLADVDCLVVSPKGPSSGMDTTDHREGLERFIRQAHDAGASPRLKAVIFDDTDLEYARWLGRSYPDLTLHLSAGTDVGLPEAVTIERLRGRFRWLCERVASDRELCRARVSFQQHVLAWGTRRGV